MCQMPRGKESHLGHSRAEDIKGKAYWLWWSCVYEVLSGKWSMATKAARDHTGAQIPARSCTWAVIAFKGTLNLPHLTGLIVVVEISLLPIFGSIPLPPPPPSLSPPSLKAWVSSSHLSQQKTAGRALSCPGHPKPKTRSCTLFPSSRFYLLYALKMCT